jgi:hypothetical protein
MGEDNSLLMVVPPDVETYFGDSGCVSTKHVVVAPKVGHAAPTVPVFWASVCAAVRMRATARVKMMMSLPMIFSLHLHGVMHCTIL